MTEIQNDHINYAEEVLEHHGILGMKWGIRRYQPYPSGYSGDGEFIGKREARKIAKANARQARHKAKTNTRIKNAVETGDKKRLKKYQDEMTPEEYEKKYAETVKNGIDNAVKDRDKSALKKYKDDLNKRDYQHQKDRIEFKEAIDDDNSRKTKKLLSTVDPEDVVEATNLIRSRVALQDQKLSKIRQDSELMARLDKLNSGVTKVSNLSKNVASITSSFMDMSKKATEFSNAQKDQEEKARKKKIEKVIKSGDVELIKKHQDDMNLSELQTAYERVYTKHQKEVDDAIKTGDREQISKIIPYMDNEKMSKAITKLSSLAKQQNASNTTTVNQARNDAGIGAIQNWLDSGYNRAVSENVHIGDVSSIMPQGEVLPYEIITHSDDISYEDVLSHHGILGMKWGVRRYQPYPKGYTGDGRYVGSNASKNLAEDLNSLIKKGTKFEDNYRKSLLGFGYKRNERAVMRNAYRKNAVKSNTKQKIGEYVLTNEKTNKTFKKYEKAIKEYANARDEEDKRPKVEDKIFNDVKKYNELLDKVAEDYIKKNNYDPSEAYSVRSDAHEIFDSSDIIEAAMKYEPGFKEQYLKETKRYREASAAFNKACDEITKSIVEDNGNIPIRSLYTSDEYNTRTFDKVVNATIREIMIGYPYQNNSK